MVDRVGHPACGLLLDTFHMNIEEQSIGDAIRAAGPRLATCTPARTIAARRDPATCRGTRWRRRCATSTTTDAVVIESFTSQVKWIARAAAIWRPLAASQDALAQNGLGHLRGLFGRVGRLPLTRRAGSLDPAWAGLKARPCVPTEVNCGFGPI